ncbi:hypothetical protein PIB30_023377 [Stylosanthes scabra]|uniref:Uncharacterized protein n=1 Tax=Stylosanthes scabra TaxID=79078 RepID=A0ABU6VBQ4_9FABA|nr:hypothetical protein [Stylosanthes scabra]
MYTAGGPKKHGMKFDGVKEIRCEMEKEDDEDSCNEKVVVVEEVRKEAAKKSWVGETQTTWNGESEEDKAGIQENRLEKMGEVKKSWLSPTKTQSIEDDTRNDEVIWERELKVGSGYKLYVEGDDGLREVAKTTWHVGKGANLVADYDRKAVKYLKDKAREDTAKR